MYLLENKYKSPMMISVVLMLLISMMSVTAGNLLAGHNQDDCRDHCDDTCQTCDDCIHCLPIIDMVAAANIDDNLTNQVPSWAVYSLFLHNEIILAKAIDHPPQNSSLAIS